MGWGILKCSRCPGHTWANFHSFVGPLFSPVGSCVTGHTKTLTLRRHDQNIPKYKCVSCKSPLGWYNINIWRLVMDINSWKDWRTLKICTLSRVRLFISLADACEQKSLKCCVWMRCTLLLWCLATTLPGRSSTSGLIKPCLHEASRHRQAMCCAAKSERPSPPAPLSKMEISRLPRQTMHQRDGGLCQTGFVLPLPLLIKHQYTFHCFWSFDFGLQSRQWLAVEWLWCLLWVDLSAERATAGGNLQIYRLAFSCHLNIKTKSLEAAK